MTARAESPPQGWLCPACHGAHAPDVKSCPVPEYARWPMGLPVSQWPSDLSGHDEFQPYVDYLRLPPVVVP